MPTAGLDALGPPRLVDGGLLAVVVFEVASGLVSLVAGTPDWEWLFVLHGVAGLALALLLALKLRSVWPRIRRRAAWDRSTLVSLLLVAVAVAAIGTGLTWTLVGTPRIAGFTLLTVHMGLGLLALCVLVVHLRHHLRLPRTTDLEGRRTALQFGAVLGLAALGWRAQQFVGRVLDLAGADRRFTGSKRAGGDGNDFPVTSWVADDPDPVDREAWELTVTGAVQRPVRLTYADVTRGGSAPVPTDADTRATLDCTSGWYAEREWEGIRVGDLLAAVGPTADANWVRFRSVTGYKWCLPLEEARDALLATRVDGDPLSHGHGGPVRLVAPGRRGFQWVKWVQAVDLRRHEDLSQWIAIHVSGFG